MKCPFCGYEDSKVIDSRPLEDKKRRRRECMGCRKRFTTYEIVEKPLPIVVKRDGSFEPFDRNKLLSGIGSIVLERLRSLDAIAYIRFASVYQDFKDVAGFIAAISALNDDE